MRRLLAQAPPRLKNAAEGTDQTVATPSVELLTALMSLPFFPQSFRQFNSFIFTAEWRSFSIAINPKKIPLLFVVEPNVTQSKKNISGGL